MSSVNPFVYETSPHVRRHGPEGYSTYEPFRDWLRDDFDFRCVYCLFRENWGRRAAVYHVDHFVPRAIDPSRECEYDNLLYLCCACNTAKGKQPLPDPCRVALAESLKVHGDGRIEPLDDDGTRLVDVLRLDNDDHTRARRMMLRIIGLSEKHDTALFVELMGYPSELPDLSARRPKLNRRPQGIFESCFERHRRGTLPVVY